MPTRVQLVCSQNIFVDGLLQSTGHGMGSYWNIHRHAVMQKLTCYDMRFSKLKGTQLRRNQAAMYTNKRNRSNTRQSSCHQGTIKNPGSSNKICPQRSHRKEDVEVVALNDKGVTLLINSISTVVNKKSTDDLENVLHCRMSQQSCIEC